MLYKHVYIMQANIKWMYYYYYNNIYKQIIYVNINNIYADLVNDTPSEKTNED